MLKKINLKIKKMFLTVCEIEQTMIDTFQPLVGFTFNFVTGPVAWAKITCRCFVLFGSANRFGTCALLVDARKTENDLSGNSGE